MTTLGELLDLIGPDGPDVVELVDDGVAVLRGRTKSYLWTPYKGETVELVRIRDGVLRVRLKEGKA